MNGEDMIREMYGKINEMSTQMSGISEAIKWIKDKLKTGEDKFENHETRIRDLENQNNRWRGMYAACVGLATAISLIVAVIVKYIL